MYDRELDAATIAYLGFYVKCFWSLFIVHAAINRGATAALQTRNYELAAFLKKYIFAAV
jgi:hypothetical protein